MEKQAKEIGCRHDDYHVSHERDEKGFAAHAQAFQRAGAGDGDGGYDESQAYDMQGSRPGLDRVSAVCEHSDQLIWATK